MPYAYLKSGNAKVWCKRLMPADALYANIVVLAKVKVDTTVEASPKLIIKHTAVRLNSFSSSNQFSILVDALKVTEADSDGYKTYPLFAARMLGKGEYGNTFRIRTSSSIQSDEDYGVRCYRFEVLDSSGGLSCVEPFIGSFYPDAYYDTNSLYLYDKINDKENGSIKIELYVCEDSFEDIFNLYKTSVDTDTTLTLDTIDLLFGKDMTGVALTDIVIKDTETGAAAPDAIEGIPLSGGDDGSFKATTDTATRTTAINDEYINVLKGTTDKSIASKRKMPVDVLMDANYADEVKKEFVSLLIKRYDAFGYIDGGILQTIDSAITWAQTFTNLGDKIFSKDFQHFMIKDPFSGKNIPMTMTYFYAQCLPLHFRNPGNQIPFVGELYTLLTGVIKDSLKPFVDADDDDIIEELYKLRVNYYECIAEGKYIRGTQTTSQNIWSDLSEEHNMHVLLEMKRILENEVNSKSYSFNELDDRNKFTEKAKRLMAPFINKKVRTCDVYFASNAFEEERSILHCYLSIVFKSISKRNIVEIDINKRV
jgi:hypothetical protein